jgi:hypothetical protein
VNAGINTCAGYARSSSRICDALMNAETVAIPNSLWELRWKFSAPGTTGEYDRYRAFFDRLLSV